MELQETVLVSEGEGEGMAVHRFAPDELVIQDAVEDVVSEYVHCDEDEDVAVETCVMALEGEEEGVAMGDIPEDGLDSEQQEDDQDGCGDYLMISCKFTSLLLDLNVPLVLWKAYLDPIHTSCILRSFFFLPSKKHSRQIEMRLLKPTLKVVSPTHICNLYSYRSVTMAVLLNVQLLYRSCFIYYVFIYLGWHSFININVM